MMSLVYYLPIWFQVILGVSAVDSGIRTFPLVLSLVVGAIGSGQIVGRIGYYTPLAIVSSVVMPIGTGLITTLNVNSSSGMWIGYQVLCGLGLGLGMQQASLAAQTVLDRIDVPTGVSLMFFGQMLGGAIFVSVAQNILEVNLVKGLTGLTGLNPQRIVHTGATEIRTTAPAQYLPQVVKIYNDALRHVFIVSLVLACLSILDSTTLEWRNIKGKQGTGGEKSKPEAKTEAEV